jgi:hypothetical protein
MRTNTITPPPRGVDPQELDRHIAEMYRDVANEAGRDLHFPTERTQRTSDKYGAHSVSLLALDPVRASRHASRPDLGGGADVARAAPEEAFINTKRTEEVSK